MPTIGYAQSACTLDVIAGEYAQPTGVDRQRFVQTKLRREIGHRLAAQDAGIRVRPRVIATDILLEAAERVVDAAV